MLRFRVDKNSSFEDLIGINESLLEIMDTSQAGVLLLDDEFTILFANRTLGLFFKVGHVEMIGRKFTEFLSDEEAGLLERLHQEMKDNPADRVSVAFFDRKQSSQRIEVAYARNPGPQKPCIFYFRDITQRANFERQLAERNSFLNGLVESSVDGIIAADMRGNIILFNKGAQDLLGYTEKEAINSLHTTGLYVEGTAKEIMRKMRSVNYGGFGRCLKHRVIGLHKEGYEIPISLSGGILFDDQGKETASYGIFTDLRPVEQMQQRLQEKQVELVQSEKMASLGQLAAGVAHEVNNPLSGVLIYANLVLEDLPKDSELCEDMQRIISETTRCKTIVRELLDFARQDEASCDAADINQIIREAIKLIGNQAAFHNVKVFMELEDELPFVYASPVRMNQVILNLAINAAEAMEEEGILRFCTKTIDDGEKVKLTVSDTGTGIPKEIQTKIFDPFFTTKEVGKGTGLGLSVTYRILRDCGASIEIESEPGQGTDFIIELRTAIANTSKSVEMEMV